MHANRLFDQLRFARQVTFFELKNITEEQLDEIPEGFNNSLRWNMGHIYTFQQLLLTKYGGKALPLDDRLIELFAPNTSPQNWEGEVPSLTQLTELLKTQIDVIEETLADQLQDEAARPFMSVATIGELLMFSLYHEGLHVGTIKALKKATSKVKGSAT